jgi:hypothetical protein
MLRGVVVWRQTLIGVCLALSCGWGCSSSHAKSAAVEPDAGDPAVRDRVLASCIDFASQLCAASVDCCTKAYGAYDPQGCADTLRDQVCSPAADAVQNGFAVYDDSAVGACLAAHVQANAVCIPNWDQTLELRKALWSACKVVRGLTDPGKGCSTSVTCADPDGEKTVECVGGACRVLEVLPEGAACPFQDGAVSTCDSGFYCTTTPETPGVCTAVLGSACSGVLGDPSCGFGNYCDRADKTCKKTVNLGGPGCKQGLECVSFECDRNTEVCAPAPAVIARDQCLGAAAAM